MRLFVALHPPAGVLAALEALGAGLRAADSRGEVRWVRASGIHLTLQFLGEVPGSAVPGILAGA